MSSGVTQASSQVTKAAQMFTKNGASKNVNFVRELMMGSGLGVACGLVWKMYHWNEKRKIEEYYHTLAALETAKGAGGAGESGPGEDD